MTEPIIIIASPHARNDLTERAVINALPACRVVRVRGREELAAALDQVTPEWIFFPHWSWKIPAAVFETHRCVIFHMTDLPYGRGGSPLQNLITRGHKTTKLSAIKCVAELDTGPIYLKWPLDLSGTAENILERAAIAIGQMIPVIVNQEPQPVEQTGEVAHFDRRRPEQSRVPDGLSAEQLYDFIRMLDADGYPLAFVEAGDLKIELRQATLSDGQLEAKANIRKIQ